MTDRELEARLARAVDRAAPDDLDDLLSRCREQDGKGIAMTTTKTSRPARWWAPIAACLALVLLSGGAELLYQRTNAVASVVSIDVNPSIELRVNRREEVLSCTPINEDARRVLEGMDEGRDLEGAKLTVAANAIVGALIQHGYLDGLSSAILVSVEDGDAQRALRMEEELRDSIGSVLAAQAPSVTLLSQTLAEGAGSSHHHHSAQQAADGSGTQQGAVSSGKAALVERVLALRGADAGAQDANYEAQFAQLSALTVEELNDLLEAGETRTPIGREAAVQAAQEYAGVLALGDKVPSEADPELDERPTCYEVELVVNGQEYEYQVDAFTGAVLAGRANVLAVTPMATPTPAATPAPTATPAPAATPAPTAAPAPSAAPAGLIGEEAAWAAACAHAGCARGEVSYASCELDYEDGTPDCYELEFCWNGSQYECEVDCYTGAVRQCEHELCDEEGHDCHTGSHHGGRHH